jgi:hypothetical protein
MHNKSSSNSQACGEQVASKEFQQIKSQIVAMKKLRALPVWMPAGLFLATFLTLVAGCASKPSPNWNERIGHFTFDEAVRELGPPVASTRLQDGTLVAEWFLKPGAQFSFGVGTGFYGGGGSVGVGQGVTVPTPGHYLRLVFGVDGQLQHWEKVRH